MTDRLSIALAQINLTLGGIEANIDRIRAARAEAGARGADLVLCPELAVCGGPSGELAGDLAGKPFLLDRVEAAVRALALDTADGGPALLVGAPWRDQGRLFDAVLLLDRGAVAATRVRTAAQGEDGEGRIFAPGPPPGPVNLRGVRLGLSIGADIATPDVVETLTESGAEILVHANASPFRDGTPDDRVQTAVRRVIGSGLPLLTVNLVGGQDDRVFDGASFALGADGGLVAQAPSFAEHLLLTRWERGADERWICHETEIIAPAEGLEALYAALLLAVRDRVAKGGATGVLLDLSDGLGAALTAAIAVDALGPEGVHAVTMPAPDTPRDRLNDAAEVAELLGCRLDRLPIGPALKAFDAILAPAFTGRTADAADGALEARARGVTLAALAERFGALALSTTDKSVMAVGGAVPSGGYAVLTDVHRRTALALARWRNAHVPAGARGPAGRVVPERVLAVAATAELRPGLPPCAVLDDLLDGFERNLGVPDLTARGHDAERIGLVWRMLCAAEAQRQQAPPGPRVARRAGDGGGRLPVTHGFISPL